MKNKFNVGQEVWFITNSCEVISCELYKVTVVMAKNPNGSKILYENGTGFQFTEDKLFATKEECVENWLSKQGFEIKVSLQQKK